jgi:hypothetical protein
MIRFLVKELKVGDVEDPDIYLGAVSWDWLQTEHGSWVKQHSSRMAYQQNLDPNTMSYIYRITADFEEPEALMYRLKWGDVSR